MSRSAGDVPGGSRPLLIACVYPDGRLPTDWFRACMRLKRTIERAGYLARVELAPVSDVPPDADVIVLPRDPGAAAPLGDGRALGDRERHGDAEASRPALCDRERPGDAVASRPVPRERLVVDPEDLHVAFEGLADRLVLDGRLRHGPTPSPEIAVHRGLVAVTGRARPVERPVPGRRTAPTGGSSA